MACLGEVRRWELYRADLDPAVGSEQAGERPVLIVSNDGFNAAFDVVTALPLTKLEGKRRRVYSFEVLLPPADHGSGEGPYGEKAFKAALIGCVVPAHQGLMVRARRRASRSVAASLVVLTTLGLVSAGAGRLAERVLGAASSGARSAQSNGRGPPAGPFADPPRRPVVGCTPVYAGGA